MSHGHIEKLEAQLREEVQARLKRAAQADCEELADSIDLPKQIARRKDRLKALDEAKAKIAERVKGRDEQAQKAYEEKVAGREAQRAVGQKPKGREPQAPQTGPRAKNQINLTDEESRTMPSAQGFVQGYNAQAAVDGQIPGWCLPLQSAKNRMTNNRLNRCWRNWVHCPKSLATRKGRQGSYFSQAHIEACVAQEITPLIAAGRESHYLPLEERLAVDQAPPETANPVVKMVHELKTRKGRVAESNRLRLERALYGRRKCTG